MKKILVTYAVEEEFVPLAFDGYEVEYIRTGVGKVLSAMHLTKAVCRLRPGLVLNVGTAGTLRHTVGDIFVCRHFIDRDYQAVKLPGITYEFDFVAELAGERLIEGWLPENGHTGICNTGDSFVTQAESITGDVVDMEAYAQAVVCKEFGIPFVAVKYVTDIIGQNSVKHWQDKLADARDAFREWFGTRSTLR